LYSLVNGEVISVVGVENTISIGGTRTNGEEITIKSLSIVINVVEVSASSIMACNHETSRETMSSIGIEDVGEEL
jgi:hypothetical protein